MHGQGRARRNPGRSTCHHPASIEFQPPLRALLVEKPTAQNSLAAAALLPMPRPSSCVSWGPSRQKAKMAGTAMWRIFPAVSFTKLKFRDVSSSSFPAISFPAISVPAIFSRHIIIEPEKENMAHGAVRRRTSHRGRGKFWFRSPFKAIRHFSSISLFVHFRAHFQAHVPTHPLRILYGRTSKGTEVARRLLVR